MKKFKKGVVIRRLRRLQAEVCHLRDQKCQRCGREEGKLDTSHIFPKGHYPSMQFLMENVKLLCYQCHRWWHENPILATDWVKKYLSLEVYQNLLSASQRSETVNQDFLERAELKMKELKSELMGGVL